MVLLCSSDPSPSALAAQTNQAEPKPGQSCSDRDKQGRSTRIVGLSQSPADTLTHSTFLVKIWEAIVRYNMQLKDY